MDAFQGGIGATFGEFILADEPGQRMRCRDEHGIGRASRAGADDSRPDTGQNVRMVALAGNVEPAIYFDRIERAAAGEYRPQLSPSVSHC